MREWDKGLGMMSGGWIMAIDDEADEMPAFLMEEAERAARENGGKTKRKRKKTRVAELVRENQKSVRGYDGVD